MPAVSTAGPAYGCLETTRRPFSQRLRRGSYGPGCGSLVLRSAFPTPSSAHPQEREKEKCNYFVVSLHVQILVEAGKGMVLVGDIIRHSGKGSLSAQGEGDYNLGQQFKRQPQKSCHRPEAFEGHGKIAGCRAARRSRCMEGLAPNLQRVAD